LANKLMNFINKLRNKKIYVRFLRLNDAGENYALEKSCKDEKLNIKLENSGPRTPQGNGKVEQKFQTLYGQIRAMMNDSGIAGEFCEGLRAECAAQLHFMKILP
jgi:hypothetical protein